MANVPSTPDIYFRTVQFYLSVFKIVDLIKGEGYTIPIQKNICFLGGG
jgi:hypothetical protein